ncbi:hypothetical protein ACLOJK_013403 [Asimina triloba]
MVCTHPEATSISLSKLQPPITFVVAPTPHIVSQLQPAKLPKAATLANGVMTTLVAETFQTWGAPCYIRIDELGSLHPSLDEASATIALYCSHAVQTLDAASPLTFHL